MPSLFNEQDMIYAVNDGRAPARSIGSWPSTITTWRWRPPARSTSAIPGMGDTTARYFRDKLAMRVRANDRGMRVPDFVHVLNYDKIR